jgi:hypothetical protein
MKSIFENRLYTISAIEYILKINTVYLALKALFLKNRYFIGVLSGFNIILTTGTTGSSTNNEIKRYHNV